MKILTNCKIFTGEKILQEHSVIISDSKIDKIIHNSELNTCDDCNIINLNGQNLCPGFIDLQVNGFGGALLNSEISEDCLSVMLNTSMKYGATSISPTLITTSDENMLKAMELVKNLPQKFKYNILGLHIEGPYISQEKKGVHNTKFVRPVSNRMIKAIAKCANFVNIITVAPEVCDSDSVGLLNDSGITVSLGHTNASYEQAKLGIDAGITMATHLYNAMSGYRGRTPGAIGAALNNDSVYAGIIVDGHHVTYPAIEIAKKIKRNKLFLVTDAAAPAGTDMPEFIFEDTVVYHKDGKLLTADGTLGGSVLTMIDAVKNTVNNTFIDLEEALKMATVFPAESIGMDNEIGYIRKGYIANLVAFDENYSISHIFNKGEIVV